jgi:nucleoside-diphosphate-sugar epimerase
MPVFITGASGFLGGRLAQMLLERGEEVVVLARPTADLTHLSNLPIQVVRGDLSDVAALREAVREAHTIYHCAACSTDWAPVKTYYEANVVGTRNLLTAASYSTRLRRVVHISTCDVYGYPRVPCDETQPAKDVGLPYNTTKCQGEAAVWEAAKAGLPVTVLRPATIYGPRGKDFVAEVAELLRQGRMAYIGSGRARGGFTYVDNVVEAVLAAGASEAAAGEAFNISDGTNATWKDYVTRFAAALGYREPRIYVPFSLAMGVARVMEAPHRALRLSGRPLLTRHAVCLLGVDREYPTGKARRVLGLSPKVGLEEGIERSVAWLRNQPGSHKAVG